MSDSIKRQAAIDTVHRMREICDTDNIDDYKEMLAVALEELCPVQLETQPEIDEILNYLDTVLHPLVSPEHWDVYATLHDMISLLHFKQPQRMGWWIQHEDTEDTSLAFLTPYHCSECGAVCRDIRDKWCYGCGARMENKG